MRWNIDVTDIDPDLLLSLIQSSSGAFFFNKQYNLIEEMNINALADTTTDVTVPLTKFFSIIPSFPNLLYLSLSSWAFSWRLSDRLADGGIDPPERFSQQHSHFLHHRWVFVFPLIPDSPKLKKIEVGNDCLKNLDTFRISGLPLLTSLSIGDGAFDDECSHARIGGRE